MTVIIIIAAAVVLLGAGAFALARMANRSDNKQKQAAGNKAVLTAEQSEDLKKAGSTLVSIRMAISRLKDTEISSLGASACDSIDRVLRTLKEKPEKIQTSRQLFNYYIPTLEKVISKYQRIEAGNVAGSDMPEKLKDYLKDVSSAMENLYEGLFENDKLHVSVDMEAMTMAIKRDGLLDEEELKAIPR